MEIIQLTLNFSDQIYLWNFTIFEIRKNPNINYLSITDRYYIGISQVVIGHFFDDANNEIRVNFNDYFEYDV